MVSQVLGNELADKLGKSFTDVISGKGGYWIKGDRFYTVHEARKITGIKAPLRVHCVLNPDGNGSRLVSYGDYATLRAIIGKV